MIDVSSLALYRIPVKTDCYILDADEGGRHKPFMGNYRPQFHFRTADVTGALELPKGADFVTPGSNVKLGVRLIQPLPLLVGQRFAIREGGKTIGTGVITALKE